MQRSIFQAWIRLFNREMQKMQRNILLLVDNVSSHQLEEGEELSNIKLYFLPPNTTSHLQPIDQGIIRSFKVIIIYIFFLNNKYKFIFNKFTLFI
jgi:hypothetical protein